MSTYPDDFDGLGNDFGGQFVRGMRSLPPVDITYRDRTNSPEELLELVLSEGSPVTFEAPLRWGYSRDGVFPDTPIPGAVTTGIVERILLSEDEWQRLGAYLFAETNDRLPAAPLKYDPEAYCRKIIAIHYNKQEN